MDIADIRDVEAMFRGQVLQTGRGKMKDSEHDDSKSRQGGEDR